MYLNLFTMTVLLTAFLGSRATVAQPKTNGDKTRAILVMLAPSKNRPMLTEAAATIEASLQELHVALRMEWVDQNAQTTAAQIALARRVTKKTNARAALWLDFSEGERVFLFLSTPSGGRTLVRELALNAESTVGRFETIALVVSTMVSALMEGGRIGVERVPKPPPQKPAVSAPLPPEPLPLDLSVAYGIALYDTSSRITHGLQLSVGGRPSSRLQLYAAYSFAAKVKVSDDLIYLNLEHHPLEIGASVLFTGKTFGMALGGEAIVDWMTWSTLVKSDTVVPVNDSVKVVFKAALQGIAYWILSERIRLFMKAAGELQFNADKSYISLETNDRIIVDRLLISPHVLLGISTSPF